MTLARIVIDGHTVRTLYPVDEAEILACRWRGEGARVQVVPADGPPPHGDIMHVCHDGDPACLTQARKTGEDRRYHEMNCPHGADCSCYPIGGRK